MGINRKKIFLRTNGNAATYINGMNHHCDACPKPGPRFPMTYVVVFFLLNDFWREENGSFVDISRIVYHHCSFFPPVNFHSFTSQKPLDQF